MDNPTRHLVEFIARTFYGDIPETKRGEIASARAVEIEAFMRSRGWMFRSLPPEPRD